jgi:uncharacterized protein DUF2510
MSNIAGSLNSLIWLLIVIVVIAVVIWAVRMAFAPRGDTYREPPVVQQRVPSQPAQAGSLSPGWYPDQNDHRMMRYYDGRVWTSETRGA